MENFSEQNEYFSSLKKSPFLSNSIRHLGVRSLFETLPIMDQMVLARARGEIENTLLLVNHPPVYTIGRGIQKTIREKNPKLPQESLPTLQKRLPCPLFEVTRGGGITYHDLGQMVGYPIVLLEPKKGFGLKDFLKNLEEMLIEVLQQVIPYECFLPSKEKTGIWVRNKKVVSLGIAVRRWVTYHGFAINISSDLNAFQRIQPCGLEASSISNLNHLAGREIDQKEILKFLLPAFYKRFQNKENKHEQG